MERPRKLDNDKIRAIQENIPASALVNISKRNPVDSLSGKGSKENQTSTRSMYQKVDYATQRHSET